MFEVSVIEFSSEEQLALEKVALLLREQGEGSVLPVGVLLQGWCRFASTIRDVARGPDDFIEFLFRRDALESLVRSCSGVLAEKLRAAIDEADDAFRSATVDDGGATLSAWSGGVGDAWWWHRRPVTGHLSRVLDKKR
ncbi:hypothetical protein LY474_28685 [Myxococcus stipitatus]|uniref:hypothetical protein n=1 Tax=Myxococcus stipitatus TaxID=83455 RepID=UPI001F3DEDE7|nr:hypothetical protein [Myxococcus stipitatus]MCE9671792.1 hypothetical protein [Myxococcus stipitatus]